MAGDAGAFGALLRRLRLRAGLTQEALAERAGLSPRGLLHLERGTRRPQPDTLRRLAEALALTPAERAGFADASRADVAPAASPLPAAPAAWLPAPVSLVGRDPERAALRDALGAAIGGRGALVLIGGEAGIGKTALAEAALAEAADQGAAILVGRCYDLSETPPYGPWAEALARAPVADGLPALPAAVLSPGRGGEALPSREAILARVVDYLAALAARQPLALLLEDLHWADPASLDLLRIAARGLAGLPLLILATYRDDELGRGQPLHALLPALVREARAARLDLRPLDPAAIDALVAARYGLGAAEGARLAGYLAARTEGNALFLGELLRTLEQAGALRREGARWALGDLAGIPVPALLRQVIEGRAARLAEGARRLLAVAAVLGQEVPLALWRAVAVADEEALLDAVDGASAARLLDPTPDGAGVRFAHALIREALYAGIAPPRRAREHRRAADALLALPAPDPDALVHHLRAANDPRLGRWLFAAGTRAFRAAALATAAARYAEALPLLAAPGDRTDRFLALYHLVIIHFFEPASVGYAAEGVRVAEALGDAPLAAFALARLGVVRALNGDIAAGLAEQERAVAALAAHPGYVFGGHHAPLHAADYARGTLACTLAMVGRLREARALLREGGLAINGYFALMICEAMRGDPAGARAVVRDYLATLQAHDARNIGPTLAAELVHVVLPYHADDPATVRAVAGEAEAMFARVGEELLGFPPRLPQLGPLILHGQWAEALAFLPLARRLRHTQQADFWAFPLYGALLRARGERALAWALVREAFPAGAATAPGGVTLRYALALQRTAAALALDEGDLAAARGWLEAHDRWLAWSGAVPGRAEVALGWAAYHRATGDQAEARAAAEAALAHASDPRQPLALLAAHRLAGELDTEAGRFGDARGHLDAALALAEACEAPYERALTLLALTEWRAATGDREGASAALAEARAILEPLGARPALARAAAIATRLAAPAVPASVPAALPFGLTAREAEVLRLVAQGLTSAEVAAGLFLSARTVEQHLRAAYAKLGAENRADAVRLAVERGLI